MKAACELLSPLVVLEASLEAFVELSDSRLVKIVNPNSMEREAAESVLLRCTSDDYTQIVKTLKAGRMLL